MPLGAVLAAAFRRSFAAVLPARRTFFADEKRRRQSNASAVNTVKAFSIRARRQALTAAQSLYLRGFLEPVQDLAFGGFLRDFSPKTLDFCLRQA
jgi:hypothetical protein